MPINAGSRKQLFDYLDQYALFKRAETDHRSLAKDSGLIKSYLIEKQDQLSPADSSFLSAFEGSAWGLHTTTDEALFRVYEAGEELGYLEVLSSRHLVLHSTLPTKVADASVRRAIGSSAKFDLTWLAGLFLQSVWQETVQRQTPEKFVTFRFEHEAFFEESFVGRDSDDDDDDAELTDHLDGSAERHASMLAITERSRSVAEFLPRLQELHAPFRSIKMLRIPASQRGGYDFWGWGKVTHRALEFREGRGKIETLAEAYTTVTRKMEDEVWLHADTTSLSNGGTRTSLTGSPVTFVFNPPLSDEAFARFIDVTFDRGRGPFRLQGNPLRVGKNRVHIYGLDLHLWKPIYLEVTPQRMLLVLPRGTCGNTVHRLTTNIQRFLSPSVEVFVAGTPYKSLIEQALRLGKKSEEL